MSNPSKAKGTDAENRVRDYFRAHGWPDADRLTLSGKYDRGDVRLGDGVPVTIEVKGGQNAVSNLHSHVRELKAEMANNEHHWGAVVAKKPGSNDVENEWLAVMPLKLFNNMIYLLYKHGDLHDSWWT